MHVPTEECLFAGNDSSRPQARNDDTTKFSNDLLGSFFACLAIPTFQKRDSPLIVFTMSRRCCCCNLFSALLQWLYFVIMTLLLPQSFLCAAVSAARSDST